MTAEETFWYWVNERHRIHLKKMGGESPPWTSDPILQKYKFTNVFRELDRTTVWVKENIRNRFTDGDLIFMLALFRQTGTIAAGQLWNKLWDKYGGFYSELWAEDAQQSGVGIYTGAYMLTGSYPEPKGTPKIVSQMKHCLLPVWEDRHWLYAGCVHSQRLRTFCDAMSGYPGWGGTGFLAYEVACDLRYTPILEDAKDKMTWSNPGPGAQRGLSRIAGVKVGARDKQLCINEMQYLLSKAYQNVEAYMPALELREIEHSLCEFDKYMRVKNGEGRPRSLYHV